METIASLYKVKCYEKLFERFSTGIYNESDVKYILYALFETGNWLKFSLLFDEYISLLETNEDLSKLYGYMGLYQFRNGEYAEARENFLNAVRKKGHFSKNANNWLKVLKLEEYNFINVEKLNFIFDNSVGQLQRDFFIEKYVNAYKRINRVFPLKSKKISMCTFSVDGQMI